MDESSAQREARGSRLRRGARPMLDSSGGAAFPASPPLAYGALMRRIAFSLVAAFAAYFAQPLWRATQNAIAETRAKPSSISFTPGELAADRDGASLIAVPAPGRYSIRAKSPSGARIELVDMIAGPLDSSGAPGLRDGRIDALLDKGVYKLRVFGVKGASGKAALSAQAFVEAGPSKPTLAPGRIQSGELGDLQQRSYSFDVGAEGRVSLEAIGRALSDLRVWRSDGELVDLAFEQETVETKPGRAMTRLRVEGALEPGRYVVTAYGGEALAWTDGASAQPFMLRLAEPVLLAAGVAELNPDLRRAVLVHELDDLLPALDVLVIVEAGAAGSDSTLGRDIGHLRHHEARAADGSTAEVNEVPLVGHPVHRGVLAHRGDHDAVLEHEIAKLEGREERRRDSPGRAIRARLGEFQKGGDDARLLFRLTREP